MIQVIRYTGLILGITDLKPPIMKRMYRKIVEFFVKEWFLLVMLFAILVVVLLFEML